MENVEIVSGGRLGTDALGGRFANERGLRLTQPQEELEGFAKAAGYQFCTGYGRSMRRMQSCSAIVSLTLSKT